MGVGAGDVDGAGPTPSHARPKSAGHNRNQVVPIDANKYASEAAGHSAGLQGGGPLHIAADPQQQDMQLPGVQQWAVDDDGQEQPGPARLPTISGKAPAKHLQPLDSPRLH